VIEWLKILWAYVRSDVHRGWFCDGTPQIWVSEAPPRLVIACSCAKVFYDQEFESFHG